MQIIYCPSLRAADDIILYPRGMDRPGLYIPGYRTYSSAPYINSPRNVAALQELKQTLPTVRLSGFSSSSPGKTSLACRLSYPVYFPGKAPYEIYLAEALRAELFEAGLYDDRLGVPIAGHLVTMDFSSFGSPKWIVEATFSVPEKEPIAIKYEYPFSVGSGAARACGDTSIALVPAIQGFLLTVYSDPKFKALFNLANPTSQHSDPEK